MRTLSLTMVDALFSQQTGEVPVVLLTLTHEDLDAPVRLASNPTARLQTDPLVYGHVSRGETYLFLPMSVTLPDESDERPPAMQVVLDNIDRELVPLLRSTDTPARARIELVLASRPDDVEIELPEFDVPAANYNGESITLTLGVDSLATEPFPAGTFTPAQFAALF